MMNLRADLSTGSVSPSQDPSIASLNGTRSLAGVSDVMWVVLLGLGLAVLALAAFGLRHWFNKRRGPTLQIPRDSVYRPRAARQNGAER